MLPMISSGRLQPACVLVGPADPRVVPQLTVPPRCGDTPSADSELTGRPWDEGHRSQFPQLNRSSRPTTEHTDAAMAATLYHKTGTTRSPTFQKQQDNPRERDLPIAVDAHRSRRAYRADREYLRCLMSIADYVCYMAITQASL